MCVSRLLAAAATVASAARAVANDEDEEEKMKYGDVWNARNDDGLHGAMGIYHSRCKH